MKKNLETLIYEISFRVRLSKTAWEAEKKFKNLTPLEMLILEILDMKEGLTISGLGAFCPRIQHSRLSSATTQLEEDKGLVDKERLASDKRIVSLKLTSKGKKVLEEHRKEQTSIFAAIKNSFGELSHEEENVLRKAFENCVKFFNKELKLPDM